MGLRKAQLMAYILKSPITMKLGRRYLGNGLNAELTAFYLDFKKELILERDAQNNGIWTDLGATSHKGVELGLAYDFAYLTDALEGLKTL